MSHPASRLLGLLCAAIGMFLSFDARAEDIQQVFPPVRDVQLVDQAVWAVGDGGLVLRSFNGGETFQPPENPIDPHVHIQALRKDGPAVCLLGGRAVAGFPTRAALGVILRSDDGGETFQEFPTGPLGWLYDGLVVSDSALAAGQATPTTPGGVYHTVDAGAHWKPVELRGRGYLRSAAFTGFRFGYLVGANRRIVSLRDFGEPEYYQAPAGAASELQAVAMVGPSAAWCVGRDGSVLASQPNTAAWRQKLLPIPAGVRRLADFETIAARENRICIGGGLTGLVFHSDDKGNTFTARSAPLPGPVHTLQYIPGPDGNPRLLAGGDAGRLWRSDDDGQSWRLVHGPGKTDVLFVAAAGDVSIYPAVVAHAAAGLSTAVLYLAAPQTQADFPAAPDDQWLRAAAVRAGAGGATTLGDFPSIDPPAGKQHQTAEDILAAWSARLDAPAEPILLEQIAAAVRLYRPTILAVGPDAAGPQDTNTTVENRLIARLARKAAARAADEKAFPSLLRAGLPPHAVQRIYVGLPENARYTPPWEAAPPLPRKRGLVRIDGTAFPKGRRTCVSLLAQEAIWLLGDPSLRNRPAQVTAYLCRTAPAGGELFTQGLGTNYFPSGRPSHTQKMLASGATLRMADVGERIMTALPDLLRAAREKGEEGLDPSCLAADGMLLTWRRLCQQGQLVLAAQARDEFLRVGQSHPLYRMMNVRTLATTCSAEYGAQRRRVSPDASVMDDSAGRAAKKFAQWHPWADDGPGRMLLVRTMLATVTPMEVPRARQRALHTLKTTVRGAFPERWKRLAAFEADCLASQPRRPVTRNVLFAPLVTQAGNIDGRLDEEVWKSLPARRLVPPGGKLTPDFPLAEVRAFRTPGAIVLGLSLPAQVGRVWRVTLAMDSDRDAWTQLQIEFDTTGHKAGYLACRLGPSTKLAYVVGDKRSVESRLFLLQAPREADADGRHTFELALPIHQAGVDPRERGLWNFQIRAQAEDADGVQYFYLQPQDAPELLPERFALLEFPPTN
ncbi:MAG: hypothetical protein JW849_01320 [Phycisphaerae bacterium]|nr:hypothetical protein [Phycisphaerae bacterium]